MAVKAANPVRAVRVPASPDSHSGLTVIRLTHMTILAIVKVQPMKSPRRGCATR